MQNNESRKIGGEFHALTNLEKARKCTLLIPSSLGIGAVSLQITIENVTVSKYAQYEESVQLIFKLKGKRNLQGTRFHGSQSVAVWEGWVEIHIDPYSAPMISKSGLVGRESRYLSFDDRYMTDAITSVNVAPIFSKIG